MKFINLNSKTIFFIFAIITISLTFISSSEVENKTFNLNTNTNKLLTSTNLLSKSTNKAKNQIKAKLTSRTNSKVRKYSFKNPPGTPGGAATPQITASSPAGVLNPPPTPNVTLPQPAGINNPNPTQQHATGLVVDATKGQGDVILNDWLRISSKTFHTHYHEIDMGFHGDNISIRTDSYDFRINDAFGKDKNPSNQPISEDHFWFRLTKDLIFYSNTKHDLNLLGGMNIAQITEGEGEKRASNQDYCFYIQDTNNHDWEVCSQYEKVRNTWFCKIQELRKEPKPAYCTADGNENIKVIVKNVSKLKY